MTTKITVAMGVVLGEYHITLAYCDATGKKGKVSTWLPSEEDNPQVKVVGVEYWSEPDITVLLVDSEFIYERKRYYEWHGYTYGHEFIPHVTIQKGNHVTEWEEFIGDNLSLIGETFRLIE